MPNIIQPNSTIHFLSGTGLVNYSNQRYFSSTQQQTEYFLSKRISSLSYDNYRFIRKDSLIYIEMNYESFISLNVDYCMYLNRNFSDSQWVYAFVVNAEYVNDSTTAVKIELDAWQTFMRKCSYGKCMIVRKHTQQYQDNTESYSKVITNQTYPEGLEIGDYEVTHTYTKKLVNERTNVLIGCSARLNEDFGSEKNPKIYSSLGGKIDNIDTGLSFYLTPNIQNLQQYLKDYPWISQCIQFAIQVPDTLINIDSTGVEQLASPLSFLYRITNNYKSAPIDLQVPQHIFSHFPVYRNTKLYTFPYSYIEVSNNCGDIVVLKPELFKSKTIDLSACTYLGQIPKIVVYPRNYATQNDNGTIIDKTLSVGESLNMNIVYNEFPNVPTAFDNKLMYEAQNARSLQLSNNIAQYNKQESIYKGIIEGGAGALGSLLKGNLGGVVSNIYGGVKTVYEGQKNNEIQIRKNLAKVRDSQLVAPSVSNLGGNSSFAMANDLLNVTVKWKTVRKEYADRLESYFDRYGYLVNQIGLPMSAFRGNTELNYLQTDGCIIQGDIPQEYTEIIEGMFDNGVTFWHNLNEDIGTYTTNPRG